MSVGSQAYSFNPTGVRSASRQQGHEIALSPWRARITAAESAPGALQHPARAIVQTGRIRRRLPDEPGGEPVRTCRYELRRRGAASGPCQCNGGVAPGAYREHLSRVAAFHAEVAGLWPGSN